jgi:hypothetical protein
MCNNLFSFFLMPCTIHARYLLLAGAWKGSSTLAYFTFLFVERQHQDWTLTLAMRL